MQDILLPLFPLQLVLFPRTPLPLHIFEERYKEMIGEAIQNRSEFGIVQAAERGIVNTGCAATVEKVLSRHDDGRLDILVLGSRRFEVFLLNDERSFLRGAVQFFEDEPCDPPSDELRQIALKGFDELRVLEDVKVIGTPDITDPQLSFQLAQIVSDLDFRQLLLSTRSEAERIRHLAEYLPSYISRLRQIAHVKTIAPRNGHAKTSLNFT
jgi:ATP-dependent Lon protease